MRFDELSEVPGPGKDRNAHFRDLSKCCSICHRHGVLGWSSPLLPGFYWNAERRTAQERTSASAKCRRSDVFGISHRDGVGAFVWKSRKECRNLRNIRAVAPAKVSLTIRCATFGRAMALIGTRTCYRPLAFLAFPALRERQPSKASWY